jgi:hypothetical protein
MFYNVEILVKDTNVVIKHKEKELVFNIEELVNRRIKDSIDKDMFKILNMYVDWKGEAFKDELFKRYNKSYNDIIDNMMSDSLELPYEITDRILDMFDYEEMKEFIKSNNLVRIPKTLLDEFNEDIEINKEGSRVQTYLKSDYLNLVVLLNILKSVVPILGMYAEVNKQTIAKEYKEYILIMFILKHPVSELEPFQKMVGYIRKLINNIKSNEEELQIRLIKKGIDEENLTYSILGGVLFEKMLLTDETKDTDSKNLITKFYSYASGRLNLKNNPTGNLKIKSKFKINPEGDDTESIIESYRVPTDITPGFMEEFNFATSDVRRLYDWLSDKKNYELLEVFKTAIDSIHPIYLPPINIKIAFILAKNIIDPRAYNYVDAEQIRNVLAVVGTVLWEKDYKLLAALLASSKTPEDMAIINYSSKLKVDPVYKELIDEKFKIHFYNVKPKTGEVTKRENLGDKILNDLSTEMVKNNYICKLPEEMIEEATGNINNIIPVPNDIKLSIIDAIIDFEENSNAKS